MKLRLVLLTTGLVIVGVVVAFGAQPALMINEVGWSGTNTSWANEWIELKSNHEQVLDLTGWTLNWGEVSINLGEKKQDTKMVQTRLLSQGGYLLLERTDQDTIPGIKAGIIYTGNLNNNGETMVLKNDQGEAVDQLKFKETGWPAGTASEDEAPYAAMSKKEGKWISCQHEIKSEQGKFLFFGTPGSDNKACVVNSQQTDT